MVTIWETLWDAGHMYVGSIILGTHGELRTHVCG